MGNCWNFSENKKKNEEEINNNTFDLTVSMSGNECELNKIHVFNSYMTCTKENEHKKKE